MLGISDQGRPYFDNSYGFPNEVNFTHWILGFEVKSDQECDDIRSQRPKNTLLQKYFERYIYIRNAKLADPLHPILRRNLTFFHLKRNS